MSERAFDKIAEGLRDAAAMAEGAPLLPDVPAGLGRTARCEAPGQGV